MADHLGYNEFIFSFKSRAQELEDALSQVENGKAIDARVIDQLSLSMTELRSMVTEAVVAGTLPTYDQRLCEERVTLLEGSLSKIRSTSKPKSKFSFKSSINARPAAQATAKTASSAEQRSAASEISSDNSKLAKLSAVVSTTKITINGHDRKVLTFADATGIQPSAVNNPAQSVVITIGGLTNCFVDLAGTTSLTVNALHVQGLTRTVLYVGKIQGSVLLHDCVECTIIVSAHQFRMHTSSATNVYLEVSSNPVIEKCTNIGFGPFPLTGGAQSIPESSSNLDKNDDRLPYTVQDFDWMGSSQSPNWSSIGSAPFQLPIDVTTESLDSVLNNLLPRVVSS